MFFLWCNYEVAAQGEQRQVDLISKYLVPNVIAIVALGLFIFQFLRMRSTVKKVVEEETLDYVKSALAQRLGVEEKSLGDFFRRYETEVKKKAETPISIIVAPGMISERQRLVKLLTDNGFGQVSSYLIEEEFSVGDRDLVVFVDDLDKSFTDGVIDTKATSFKGKAKLFYFGQGRYNGNHILTNFANAEATFVENVRKAILI